MKRFILLLFLMGNIFTFANEISVIPKPREIKFLDNEAFEITRETKIIINDESLFSVANYLSTRFNKVAKFSMSVEKDLKKAKKQKGNIFLFLASDIDGKEAYQLVADKDRIEISASTSTGIFYGIQTLYQLLPVSIYAENKIGHEEWIVPGIKINDYPEFKWRGMHLDVSRHFFPKDYIKKFIDVLALHKFNRFHWHLTDDQGWRIEIKKYPKLTSVGAWRDSTLIGHYRAKPQVYDRKRYGGFYSQEDIKEIVEYATQHHITIVPEIEMPGHAQAAVTAYPEMGCTGKAPGVRTKWAISEHIYNPEDRTIQFLKNILEEVVDLFPGEYIHIGGDEAKKNQWENSETIQQLMSERGLKDMHEMQSWFIQQMDHYLASKGKKLIGWDEILEGGLAESAAVMSWRGEAGGIAAAKMKHNVVMASNKHTYFDYYQSEDKESEPLAIGGFLPLIRVFGFNPIPQELNADEGQYIMGAQGQLWTEYINNEKQLEYMAFPRACALSEVVWLNNPQRDYKDFIKRLKTHLARLNKMEVNYRLPDELK